MQTSRTFRQSSKCFCYFFNFYYIKYIGEIMNKLKILCIPGWNEGCSVFNKIKENLSDYFEFIYVELPGFNNNEDPPFAYFPIDYARYIEKKTNNKFDFIVAHSYGGKVAVEYCLNIRKVPLILLAPSIIKPRKSVIIKLKIFLYKTRKKLGLLKNKEYGSRDYTNAKGIMKNVFMNAINTYYDYDLHNLNGKTLLIYGNKDKQTPFKEGKRIKKINNDIELVKIKGDHFVLINANFQISKLIYKFVREDI